MIALTFFLFDFDGLLVNTEHLHYQAYVNMLETQGCKLDWDFTRFCFFAHRNADALKEQIYAELPNLDPDWKKLYSIKKQIYFELIGSGKIELMPGVKTLLTQLKKSGKNSCVVTNSLLEQIQLIRAQHPILQTIPHWITREDYDKPKPHPDGYLRAIELFGKKGDRIVGFEDSMRGLTSLEQTTALPILICSRIIRYLQPFIRRRFVLIVLRIFHFHKKKSLRWGNSTCFFSRFSF